MNYDDTPEPRSPECHANGILSRELIGTLMQRSSTELHVQNETAWVMFFSGSCGGC
jgi:hypothetical protein